MKSSARFRSGESIKKDKALILLIIYLVFEYLRLQDTVLPFIAPLKIPMLITLALLFIVIGRKSRIKANVILVGIILFFVEMVLWVPFAVNNYHAFNAAQNFAMLGIALLAMVVIIDTKEKLEIVIKAWVTIHIIMSIWVITHGGKGPGGFLSDENDVCLALNAALPLTWYFSLKKNKKIVKIFYYTGFITIIAGIVATSSRGGFLGLIAAIMMMVWFSKNRFKNIAKVLVLVLVTGSAVMQILPDGYVDDMNTISDADNSTRNLRWLHWTTAWEMFKDNPVFGVGADNYPVRSSAYFHLSPYYDPDARDRSWRAAHSLYFTLISEMGLFGVIIFIVLLKEVYLINTIKSKYGETNGLQKGLLAATVSSLVTSVFISVLYYPVIWHLMVLTMIQGYFLIKEQKSND